MDPDPDPDPTPDPTLFFIDLEKVKDAKKYLFSPCPQAHYLQYKKFIVLLKFRVKILFCWHHLSPLNTFMRKGKDPEPDPDPYLCLMDPAPGGPKTCGSCGFGSGSGSRSASS